MPANAIAATIAIAIVSTAAAKRVSSPSAAVVGVILVAIRGRPGCPLLLGSRSIFRSCAYLRRLGLVETLPAANGKPSLSIVWPAPPPLPVAPCDDRAAIASATTTAASHELPIDAARAVNLAADHMQPTNARSRVRNNDVGASTGHVRSHRDLSRLARRGDYASFMLVLPRVELARCSAGKLATALWRRYDGRRTHDRPRSRRPVGRGARTFPGQLSVSAPTARLTRFQVGQLITSPKLNEVSWQR